MVISHTNYSGIMIISHNSYSGSHSGIMLSPAALN